MRIAVCPGSFDPITYGHLEIITRASKLFDRVIIAVSLNVEKNPFFTLEERVELIERCTGELYNVEVEAVENELLASYAQRVNACAIVKGLRAVSDFEYEFQMALANRRLNKTAETVFLTASAENMYLSSSLVRQIAGFGGDISDFVPPQIIEDIMRKK